MAAQLGHHFAEAGIESKAVFYLSHAGDRARLAYAHGEALVHYERALSLLQDGGPDDRAARLRMKTALTHHANFDFSAAQRAYSESFAYWQHASQVQDADLPLAPHALRLIWYPPRTLDPAMCNDLASSPLIGQLHSGLVDLTPDMTVVPDVASEWQVTQGGRQYTFRLRQDARWTDGTPVTAHDFAYAWRRVLDPELGSPVAGLLYDIAGARAYHQGRASSRDIGVQAQDDHTLVIDLENPACYFLQLLAQIALAPVPRHILGTDSGGWKKAADYVSNGPFRLALWRPDERAVLVRDRAYRGSFAGNLSKVEIRFVDPQAWRGVLDDYASNGLDLYPAMELPPSEMSRVLRQHASEHLAAPALILQFLVFDASRPPFDDVWIRRAFTLAIDRTRLADTATAGMMAPAAGGLLPTGMPGHSPEIGLPYDPAQARALLAQAGYKDGKGFPSIPYLVFPGPTASAVADDLQAQWRINLGIQVAVKRARDWPDFWMKRDSERPALLNGGWLADYPDPDDYLRVGLPSSIVGWENETYAHLVEGAARCQSQTQRLTKYREADRVLVQEAPLLPLLYQRWHMLIKPWVTRFPVSPRECWFWKDVVIEPH
jgi:ABC-type oligopeptide transport system substrate-binding subunit